MSTDSPERATLEFDSDAGSARSKIVAGFLILALVGWMGSGFVLPSEEEDMAGEEKTQEGPRAVAVAVRRSQAEQVDQVFVAEGQAEPDRDTQILAEVSGQIAELGVRRGASVQSNETIARFSTDKREADLARAREDLTRANRELENAQTLLERGISTADRVADARTGVAAAEAGLAAAQDAIADTIVKAPFAGRIEALDINVGEYVAAGTAIARIVDNSPLSITIQIPQQSLNAVRAGQAAQVDFITGESAMGEVRFVGTSADAETRTFTAEIEIENADGAIPAGISAQVRIPTGEVVAHFISPALLSLGTDGTLGIKVVTDENRVVFHKIAIERAQTEGIWVSGLPSEVDIITVGQGFVNDGERVDPRIEEEAAASGPLGGAPSAGAPSLPDASVPEAGGDDGMILGDGGAGEPRAVDTEDAGPGDAGLEIADQADTPAVLPERETEQ
ncbi:efflux RND transporter periplasmic adaptor subunit [Profundibacterium mesophilum]|uniref:Biotin-lipoyl likedomain containing protein n=1 Tax=Profundibacterium mesophilum KAUST100406-0324 TaxID=1037889 RepID=A0A921NTI7_9RHOB|nr:efflux RND transporter periplasmic adaptor subunit [Profundibacterium mesophilum]KAF0675250.1 Biotin-lipoyl likedomain containing protein [Profundibacterium mesophilum KAUST100406-0324]